MKRLLLLTSVAVLGAGVARADDATLRDSAKDFFSAIPAPAAPANEVETARVELGSMLFFDPRMSSSGLLSCNTCHQVGMGGVDGLETSIGHGWQKGPRNAPTVLNATFNIAQFWDGRAPDLAAQAKGPVQASVEMNNTPDQVVMTINSMQAYKDKFAAAFPDEADPVSFDNFANAIAAFEAKLVTPGAPFDRWLEGDDAALNDQQKQGLELFMNEGCSACHNGVNFGGQDYFPFGVVEKPGGEVLPEGDLGRFAVTETAGDDYVFRAAPLRNVALTAPYFHSGKVWSLPEAVHIMGAAQLGANLEAGDVDAIVAFLQSLTGEQPQVGMPVLPARAAGTPRPEGF
ncbi:cytochrome-c peroxidase [Rubellimicrobium aerolatum]|uniref:Cytochrome-c peroxidase n=1 Tax=Rubellimicrobium aerolatum TaxID=490979 RepID=A0ABW0S8L8_9RHOB|nr:cytochrome-c peroxidase [Rubellimicrobium aerolatum]MBP1804653.1 cytochrome c peroxidase [Rubellimicrobium aerolatum]